MSSCYVYISCEIEGCKNTDNMYTGNADLDHFTQRNFDPIEIVDRCDFHNSNSQDSL